MEAKIEKAGLQLRKRLKPGLAPKILSAKIDEDNLSIVGSYKGTGNFTIDIYRLGYNWERIHNFTVLETGKENEFKLTIPSCSLGTYKIEALEIGTKSKLSYESVMVN